MFISLHKTKKMWSRIKWKALPRSRMIRLYSAILQCREYKCENITRLIHHKRKIIYVCDQNNPCFVYMSCQQTTGRSWARLSVQSRQHCWQMLIEELWLVRLGGCFRIPQRAVSRNASWRRDCRVCGETSSFIPRGVTVQRQGAGMPYMLITTQIRLVCILSL